MALFRDSSRFESLIVSHHLRFTCECNKEENDNDDDDAGGAPIEEFSLRGAAFSIGDNVPPLSISLVPRRARI